MTFLTTNNKHIPLRSCVVCRAKSSKRELVRIVRSPEGVAVVDISGKLPGRGIYICPDDECITHARNSGIIARSLTAVTGPEFWAALDEHVKNFGVNEDRKFRSILGLARKSGALLIGVENIEKFRRKVLVLTAEDCSDGVMKFARARENIALNVKVEELSQIIGSMGRVQVVGLPLSSGFAKKVISLHNGRSRAFE